MSPHRLSARLDAASPRAIAAVLVGWYALVQAVYLFFGLGPGTGWSADFYQSGMGWGWQFVDLHLLRDRLAESLLYLHTQPPLYNLYIGLLVKFFPGYEMAAYGAASMLTGLAFYGSLYAIMRKLGAGRALSLALSSLFVALPSFVLLEFDIGYDFTVGAMVAGSFLLLLRFLEVRSIGRGVALFFMLAAIGATRSLFHLSYFALFVGLLLWLQAAPPRVVLLSAALPFLLLLSIYVKNAALFGRFTTSTWMGLNAAKVVYRSSTAEQREEWLRSGIVSEVMLVEPWADIGDYPPEVRGDRRFPHVPLLHDTVKSIGYKNLHHIDYIRVSDQALADALKVYRHRPGVAAFGVASAWYCYFRTISESAFPDKPKIEPFVTATEHLIYGKLPWMIPYGKGYNVYLVLLILIPLIFFYGVRVGLKKRGPLDDRQRVAVLLMCFTIAYVALVINVFELAENQRARFYTDALSLALLAVLVRDRLLRS